MSVGQEKMRDVLRSLATRAKSRYTCKRGPRPSGALLVVNGKSVFGDVRPTPGMPSCIEAGCDMVAGHCKRNIHAEVNALLNAAKQGIATDKGVMYTINKPCYDCMCAIAHAGITRVVYAYAVYDEQRTRDVAFHANIDLIHVEI